MSDELSFDLDDLRREAASWLALEEPVGAAASTVADVEFSTVELGLAAPFHGAYSSLQGDLARLLQEGAGQIRTIGETIARAADVYEEAEVKAITEVEEDTFN